MAMLVLPDVFERTWGRACEPFWPQAIACVRAKLPAFVFMAEVYWDLEWTLLQQGFDYAYDKRLYDRLRAGAARTVREHFDAGLEYQERLARFVENHDEARAASSFEPAPHRAAAALSFLSPGLRFFHQGQLEGRRKRISPHLVRAPREPTDAGLAAFYDRLLAVLRRPLLRQGCWRQLECAPAWDGNPSCESFLAFSWDGQGERMIVAVNFSPWQGQCFVRLPFADLAGATWRLADELGVDRYERDGGELQARGLFLDEPGWRSLAFSLEAAS
jgi:hypothetical protein